MWFAVTPPRSSMRFQPLPWLIRCFQITYLIPRAFLWSRRNWAILSPFAERTGTMKSKARPAGCPERSIALERTPPILETLNISAISQPTFRTCGFTPPYLGPEVGKTRSPLLLAGGARVFDGFGPGVLVVCGGGASVVGGGAGVVGATAVVAGGVVGRAEVTGGIGTVGWSGGASTGSPIVRATPEVTIAIRTAGILILRVKGTGARWRPLYPISPPNRARRRTGNPGEPLAERQRGRGGTRILKRWGSTPETLQALLGHVLAEHRGDVHDLRLRLLPLDLQAHPATGALRDEQVSHHRVQDGEQLAGRPGRLHLLIQEVTGEPGVLPIGRLVVASLPRVLEGLVQVDNQRVRISEPEVRDLDLADHLDGVDINNVFVAPDPLVRALRNRPRHY